MNEWLGFLLRYGYWLTVGAVFLEQMGLPLPAVPILVGMGALSRSGNVSLPVIMVIALTGSMAADLIWFYLGRRYGRSMLRLVCRISLEPDFCVRRTEDAFVRHGIWTIPLGKFVPGLNAAAVPLAGMIKIGFVRFLVWDVAGLLVWSGFYVILGYIFSGQIERLSGYLARLGNSFLLLAFAAAASYIGYKFMQRRRFLKMIVVDRITPEELKSRMDTNQKLLLLDLRNQLDLDLDRFRIPGAFHALPDLLGEEADIPRHGEVVLYCTCPNEATSARVAQQLRRRGILRVRPLEGGFVAWRDRGFPLEPLD